AKGREELSKDFPPCSGSPCPNHLHFAVKVGQVARSCISHHEAQIPGFTAHPVNLVLPCLKERYEALSLLAEYLHGESIALNRVVKAGEAHYRFIEEVRHAAEVTLAVPDRDVKPLKDGCRLPAGGRCFKHFLRKGGSHLREASELEAYQLRNVLHLLQGLGC